MKRQELFDLSKAYQSIKSTGGRFPTDFIFTMERNIKSMEVELKGVYAVLEDADKERQVYLKKRHEIAKKYAVIEDGEPKVKNGSYVFEGDNRANFIKEVGVLDTEAEELSAKLDEELKPLLVEEVEVVLRKHSEIKIDLTPEEARALLIVFDE